MRKLLYSLAAALVLLLVFNLTAATQQKSQTWTGWISDTDCGAKGASADHKACALKCVKEKGAKWVFVNGSDKAVMNIANQDAVNSDRDLGQEVKLTGQVKDDGSIQVESVRPAK